MEYKIKTDNKKVILALGAESDGNFSVYKNGIIYHSRSFGDLLVDANFNEFRNELNEYLKKKKIKPEVVITDLHPLYRTTEWGRELAKKYKAEHVQVQHHIAHVFSAIGDGLIDQNPPTPLSKGGFYGIVMDGTGYGLDGKIWGGEVFAVESRKSKVESIRRIGHLENQIMIGGELAIKEPARMLISILSKIPPLTKGVRGIKNLPHPSPLLAKERGQEQKEFVYQYVKKYYSQNEFELLYNQLQLNFNCIETSSTGRILDAVAVLLGFAGNERNYKHEPIDLLEKNSFAFPPFKKGVRGIKPAIILGTDDFFALETTPLFKYLIKNLNKDKKRLAATAQLYVAQGLYEIIKKQETQKRLAALGALLARYKKQEVFAAGGILNNKIISSYLESKGVYVNKKIPRGDAGLSFGQLIYFLIKK